MGSPPQQRKRIKRDTVSSISSTEDDIDSVGGENELERSGGRLLQATSTSNFHFQKSPPGLQSPSSIWPVSQESHRDLGKRIDYLTIWGMEICRKPHLGTQCYVMLYGYLYSASRRRLFRGALSVAQAGEKKSLQTA